MANIAYCVKCKKKVNVKDPRIEEITNKHGTRKALKGTCENCGTKVVAFIKKNG